MREKKLDQLASNANYSTGPTSGQPTKIAPPAGSFTDGKVPQAGFGAQWQNHIEHYLQRQVECSAQVPFRNWLDFTLAIPATTSTPRFAHNKFAGLTLCANGVNNSIKYFQDMLLASAGAPLGVTVSPGAGPFVPKCVVAHGDSVTPRWYIGGTNAAATTKTIWKLTQNATASEQTSPVAGSVEILAKDAVTGELYAYAADANRSMLKLDSGADTWSVIGIRTGSLQTPAVATTFAAVANGVHVFAHKLGGGDIELHYGNVSPFTVNVRTLTGDASTVFDCRYSVALGRFIVLTSTHALLFADPAGAIETINHTTLGGGSTTVQGGCVTDTGWAVWKDGDGGHVKVTTWPGEAPHVFKFSSWGSGSGVFMRYDGSALWFMYDGGSADMHLFRSLRSL